ncbi:hypothetical protein [Sphingobacterium prati]|uniref:hypothetical protein n=1 Tax=Sphingobacterium prati TaxID=2737006 RepID=UPI001551A40E|nr:hypothetical protein [Sphingobacterium prati]NPE48514.1 hypothetical protein [Sphingobacterium prati]
MEQVNFQDHLDENDSIALAKILFHVGSHLANKLEPNLSADFSRVKSFRINSDIHQDAQWIPVLKCAFNWTLDIDNRNLHRVNSPHSQEEFLKRFIIWDKSRIS